MPVKVQKDQFLFDNLMVNVADSIYFKDLDSRFIQVNASCVKKHGLSSAKEMLGKSDFDFYANEHAAQAYADEQKIMETGKPISGLEERETWPDGSVTWASTSKMPLQNEAGQVVGTFGISRDITTHKNAVLRAQKYADEVRRIKDEMEEDVRLAGQLQKSFYASSFPLFPEGVTAEKSCIEFCRREKMCGEVGGDYCAINRVSAHEVSIFICDVKGIGVRSALAIALIRGVMQRISDLERMPGSYLSRMNELIYPLLGQSKELDATACHIVLDVSSGVLKFASAGHPMPILMREGEGACWLCEDPDAYGPVLGRLKKTTYTTSKFQIRPDDVLVMFTDGLFSVTNNTEHPYGLKRLIDSAQSLVGDPLDDILERLEGDALDFSKNGHFVDDSCLIGLRLGSYLN